MVAQGGVLGKDLGGGARCLADDFRQQLLPHLLGFLRKDDLGVLAHALATLFCLLDDALFVPLALLAEFTAHSFELVGDFLELGLVLLESLLGRLAQPRRFVDFAGDGFFAFDQRVGERLSAVAIDDEQEDAEVDDRRQKGRGLTRLAPEDARRLVCLFAEEPVPPVDGRRRSLFVMLGVLAVRSVAMASFRVGIGGGVAMRIVRAGAFGRDAQGCPGRGALPDLPRSTVLDGGALRLGRARRRRSVRIAARWNRHGIG